MGQQSMRVEKGGGLARFTGIKIENSRFTGIRTDFTNQAYFSRSKILNLQ